MATEVSREKKFDHQDKPGGLETRSRILQAAEECFTRYGYDSTGVAEICKAASVSKGAL